MQAMCDSEYWFTAIWIQLLAMASDFIAFLTLELYQLIKNPGFNAHGLALFGDNAYVTTELMVTPFKYVTSDAHNNFIFFRVTYILLSDKHLVCLFIDGKYYNISFPTKWGLTNRYP